MSLLRVENLHVYYGHIHAVKGLSLEVKQGEVVSLIGANGAGKTTTLHAISGLIPVREGRIFYKDEDITRKKAYLISRDHLLHVPEGRRIFTGLTVKDNLMLGTFASDHTEEENRQEMENIFHLFPILKERLEQKAGTLSGGEQQMLTMGRALMGQPDLLLLDEPSMGLSPLFAKEIFRVILHLKEQKRTILLVEQNARMALSLSDRAYVLETGKIVKEGAAEDLLADPDVKAAYLGA